MNLSIVIALSKTEDAKKLRSMLSRHGFEVAEICNTGSGALSAMSNLEAGVIISGYRFPDMMYTGILEQKSDFFEMLLIAPESAMLNPDGRLTLLSPPIRAGTLTGILSDKMGQIRQQLKRTKRPGSRSERDKLLIMEAKQNLMARNGWTEAEAHRYIQKCSMDNGTNMVETAEMILLLNKG